MTHKTIVLDGIAHTFRAEAVDAYLQLKGKCAHTGEELPLAGFMSDRNAYWFLSGFEQGFIKRESGT